MLIVYVFPQLTSEKSISLGDVFGDSQVMDYFSKTNDTIKMENILVISILRNS